MDFSQHNPLPSDMMFEIVARTSLQTMDTFKAVSKEWKQLTSDSTFMASYSKNTGNVFGYIIQSLVANKHLYKFVSPNKSEGSFNLSPFKYDDLKIEASSAQGLLCCVRSIGRQHRYYVSKPTTNQWQVLPNPKRPHATKKVALIVLSSCPLRYKIIQVSGKARSLRSDCYDYGCEIFDSKIWAWKEVEDVLLSPENDFDINPAVYASGLVSMLTKDYILAFHVDQEAYSTIPLPEQVCQNDHSNCKKILDYQGKLGLIHETDGHVELWVLEDWRSERWEMIKRLNVDAITSEIQYLSPAGFYNSEIVLMKTYLGVQFWNLQDFSFDEIQLPDLKVARHIFPFRSDWEPVNLREEKVSVRSRRKVSVRPRRKINKSTTKDSLLSVAQEKSDEFP